MFTQTQLKLTLFYSLLFLSLFWLFSIGIYYWMEQSFGEGYISQVKERHIQQEQDDGDFDDQNAVITTIAGDVALDRLLNILLAVNGFSLFVIPSISWYLAKRSLAPIQVVHEKQKQFVSDASHELRTPLSIMSGEIEVTLKKERKTQEYQAILKSNKEELGRLTSLVENLLFLAREDRNNKITLDDSVDMTDLLSSLIVQLKPIYTKKHLNIHLQPAEENIVIKGNEQLIHQLFFNLLDNAIKYTHKGEVKVILSQERNLAKIEIQDTGIGISEEHHKQLFDRFYRVDSARSEIKGYGLGLAIAQVIAYKHQGRVTIQSELHKGSTFIVFLPINI